MRKLAAWCHDRRRTVIGLWVAAFFIFAALWGTAAGRVRQQLQRSQARSPSGPYDLLKDKFPEQSGDTATVVWAVEDGSVLDKRTEIEAVRAEIEKSPEVLAVGDPFAEGAPVSEDGKITFAQIQLAKGAGEADRSGDQDDGRGHAQARRRGRGPGGARRRHHPLVDGRDGRRR